MKKIYSKPEMDVRIIEMAEMIALSTDSTPASQEAGQEAKRRRGGIFGSDDSDARNSIW